MAEEKKYYRDGKYLSRDEAQIYDDEKEWKESEFRKAREYKKAHPLTAPGEDYTARAIEKRLIERREYKQKQAQKQEQKQAQKES